MLLFVVASAAVAANPPDFSGTWVFNAGKSKNVGMMASAEYTSTITQTAKVLSVTDITVFNGQKQTHETRYDLTRRNRFERLADGGEEPDEQPLVGK